LGKDLKDQTRPWDYDLHTPDPKEFGILRLHKILLVANILSTVAVLGRQVGTEYQEFKAPQGRQYGEDSESFPLMLVLRPFENGASSFQLITKWILTGSTFFSLESALGLQIEKIDKFVEDVFAYVDQNPLSLFALASALANMSFFITPNFSAGRTDTVLINSLPLWDEQDPRCPLPMDFSFLNDLLDEEWAIPGRLGLKSRGNLFHFTNVKYCTTKNQPSQHTIQRTKELQSQLVIQWREEEFDRARSWWWRSFWVSSFKSKAASEGNRNFGAVFDRKVDNTSQSNGVGRLRWIPPEVVLEYLESMDVGSLEDTMNYALSDAESRALDQKAYINSSPNLVSGNRA